MCGQRKRKKKKTPLLNLEQELMMESWRLLKKDKEALLPPSPSHVSFDYKTVAQEVFGAQHPLAHQFGPLASQVNQFLSITLPLTEFFSAPIQKGL